MLELFQDACESALWENPVHSGSQLFPFSVTQLGGAELKVALGKGSLGFVGFVRVILFGPW